MLAVARRHLADTSSAAPSASSFTAKQVERDLTFVGLVAMMDPPRPEVAEAVEKCHHAGIRIIMITGDYGLTAESIARRIGIMRRPRRASSPGLSWTPWMTLPCRGSARGSDLCPRRPGAQAARGHRLEGTGEMVAVTGDGVNDAPALKKADIGVAMGIAGTDVAKEAADMILTDDNFASIVNAVEEGRAVYANIRKFAIYIFTSNMPEAVPFIFFLFSARAHPAAADRDAGAGNRPGHRHGARHWAGRGSARSRD